MIRGMAWLMLLALLAACAAPPVPRDHYYRLLVAAPQDAIDGALFPGVLSVRSFDAAGPLRERPILYSTSGQPLEVQQHHYHFWSDPPTDLLQQQLVAYLRRMRSAESVVTPDLRIAADWEVSGTVKRLERLIGDGPPRVVAELELVLTRVADRSLVVVDSYAAERPAADDSVAASVAALNLAVAEIFDRFLADAARR